MAKGMSGYFNDDQEDYMRSLDKIPLDQKCYCGWYRLGECQNNCPKDKSRLNWVNEQKEVKP